jgi:hypothetical protein
MESKCNRLNIIKQVKMKEHAKKRAQELFMMFRAIPPQSPYTGIDDAEAKECVKVLISVLIEETKGCIEPKSNQEIDDFFYKEVLKHVDKCKF